MSFCFQETEKEKKYYIAWLNNFEAYSIALSNPSTDKIPNLKGIFRLDHFCPTYSLLMGYKNNPDWDQYKSSFRKLLVSRKDEIDHWLSSLEENKIYILCCWENTANGANCHRKILFDTFKATKIWKDKALWVYRHGQNKSIRFDIKQPKTSAYPTTLFIEDSDQELTTISTDISGNMIVSTIDNTFTSSYPGLTITINDALEGIASDFNQSIESVPINTVDSDNVAKDF
jgi:hypothetical protein